MESAWKKTRRCNRTRSTIYPVYSVISHGTVQLPVMQRITLNSCLITVFPVFNSTQCSRTADHRLPKAFATSVQLTIKSDSSKSFDLEEKYWFNSNKTQRLDNTVRVTRDVRQVPPLDTPVAGLQSARQLRWTKQLVSSISLEDATRVKIPREKRTSHEAALWLDGSRDAKWQDRAAQTCKAKRWKCPDAADLVTYFPE